MGFFKVVLLLLFSSAYAEDVSHILYLIQKGNTTCALESYEKYHKEVGHHDCELIQNIALAVMVEGFQSKEPEVQLLSMFGAGISLNEKMLPLLERGLSSENPELQLIAMNFLSGFHNDAADESLIKALGSPYLEIRLEAIYQLAKKHHPSIVSQAESLMYKLPNAAYLFFPQVFAIIGTKEATKILRKMLVNPNHAVRLAAILSVAKFGRDDLLPQIRTLVTHHDMAEQEACALTLGVLKDEHSAKKLENLTRSSIPSIRLAAWNALYKLGRKEAGEEIGKAAKEIDLFAINLLAHIPESTPLLKELIQHQQLIVRVNAALALLEHQDPACLPALKEVLLPDSRDLAFVKQTSLGQALTAYKIVPSAQQNLKENQVAFELALGLREKVLAKTLDLPEKDFLELATLLFEREEMALIPTLVSLLENLQTDKAIALLKKYQQKTGAPLIRNWCTLALYRLRENGPYEEQILAWVQEQQGSDLIQFRPIIPWEARELATQTLTPQETSRLLVEAFESITSCQNEKGIDILLNALQHGNAKNKYALAGLLIRAAQ